MIMGAGKTSVICPLLTLLLANGKSLVTLVVPSSLLEMSRSVLRACFSNVITKRVYSFHVDRFSASQSDSVFQDMRGLRVMLEVCAYYFSGAGASRYLFVNCRHRSTIP